MSIITACARLCGGGYGVCSLRQNERWLSARLNRCRTASQSFEIQYKAIHCHAVGDRFDKSFTLWVLPMTQQIVQNTRPRFWSLRTLRTTVLAMPIAAALSACDTPADKVAPPSDKPTLTVALTTPAILSVSRTVTANGSIAAWQEAIISPEANGLRVQKLLVQEGDMVRQGQPLAEFTRDSVMNDWLLAKADLNEAKAVALNAQADGKRARLLRGVGSLSEQDIQKLLTQEKTAQARLESAKARMAAQQLRLDQTTLRAPDDGIISARSATIGSVPMQSTEMFRLIRQGKFEWRAELSAQQLEQIQPGQKAQIASPGGNTWEGVVRLAAPTVNSTSRRGIAYVDILPSTAKNASPIRPGTYASGLITVGDRQGLTVPQSAVVARDGFHLVFTVDDEMRAHPLKVAIGRLVNDQQEILSGLQGAERIVASGGVFLNEGDKVQLANTTDASHSSEPR
ncbi:efflux RND transporter periplasmic adaptor subunit [Serratia sp. CY81593]|uniref:efflux RND transporter periplasmic adaptor subunit n=1 Tax=Serratia sp. CY81593 TaxID=3383685 RepID=UPI003FA07BB4